MKIIFLSPGWPPSEYPSGIVNWISILREQLARLGHDVFVITMEANTSSLQEGIYLVSRLSRKSWAAGATLNAMEVFSPGYRKYVQAPKNILGALGKLIDETGADLIVAEESFGWCGAIAENLPLPVVATLHGPWFLCSGDHNILTATDKKRIKAEGEGLRKVAAVSAPSGFTLDSTLRYYGLQHEQAEVIPNPVRRVERTDRWALEKCDRNNILFVGRFDRLKGADVALKAFTILAQDHKDVTLTFVGPDHGLQTDEGPKIHWHDYVETFVPSAIRARIIYAGRIQPDEVISLRRRSFVTLSSSRYETFPFSVLEALSMGCPVVATDVGGIPEIIRDGRNGLLVRSGDADGFASKVRSLLDDPEYAASLGRQGAEDCCQRYDAGKITLQALDFYQGVIGRYGASARSKGV